MLCVIRVKRQEIKKNGAKIDPKIWSIIEEDALASAPSLAWQKYYETFNKKQSLLFVIL